MARYFERFLRSDWVEIDKEAGLSQLDSKGANWVYDSEHDVYCIFDMGDHVGAVRFIVDKFYGHRRIKQEEIEEWQRIIRENMILFGARVHDPSHYVHHLPKEIRYRPSSLV